MSTYDRLPYTSLPYPRTHPDHLFAMARTFGLPAAPVESCRVLEIGCGSAGNLLAMAEGLPNASFVGVDPSAGEIDRGRALVDELGLGNLRLLAGTADDVEGSFDYVVTHGVLSWVNPEIRRSILARGRALLAEHGVFYASYNVLPGWYLRGAVRGMLRRHVPDAPPEEQVHAARGLIDWLSRRITRDGGAFRTVLDEEIARLAAADDTYLFHELLEEHNHPMWFEELVEEARAAGLAWLGEADPAANVSRLASPRTLDSLRAIAGDDPIRIEQHFDFLRARTFRASLLVHARHTRRESDCYDELFVACRGPDDTFLPDPTLASAIDRLAEVWPDALPFTELGVTAAQLAPLHSAGIVELRGRSLGLSRPPHVGAKASPLSLLQARGDGPVVNRRHEPLPLTAEERTALLHLESADAAMVARLSTLALLR